MMTANSKGPLRQGYLSHKYATGKVTTNTLDDKLNAGLKETYRLSYRQIGDEEPGGKSGDTGVMQGLEAIGEDGDDQFLSCVR